MSLEFVSYHEDGSVTVVARGIDAPKVTGHFTSLEEYEEFNRPTEPVQEILPSQTILSSIRDGLRSLLPSSFRHDRP